MGSRSRPHRVLSVCMCVCVSRCLWVCVIEANSLQLRVITIGLYQFLSRSPSCQILAVCGRRLRGVSGSWFPRFLSPAAFLDSDRRRLVCPLLPCATRLSPYGKLSFCLRKAPLLPTESSASAYGKLRLCPTEAPPPPYGKLRLVSRCVLLLVINSLFPQLNPPVFIVTFPARAHISLSLSLRLFCSMGQHCAAASITTKRNLKVDLGKCVKMYRAPFLYLPGAPNSLNLPLAPPIVVGVLLTCQSLD